MNNDERYIRATNIKKMYDISYTTLRRWAEEGKIRCTTGPKRLYCIGDIQKHFNGGKNCIEKEKSRICYARVSSDHQKEDLERQIEQLKSKYPQHEIISDIGSGLNWKRKGFTKILDKIISRTCEEIVVAYKDRLCRFGYELIEQICQKTDTKLVVLNKSDKYNAEEELSEDLLSIVTVFVARNNGLRAGKNKREKARKENDGKDIKSVENPNVSN